MGTARTGETTSATDALTGVAKAAAGVGLASTADGVGVAVGVGVGNWVGACTTVSGSAQAVSNARAVMTTIPIRNLLEIIIRRICTSLLAVRFGQMIVDTKDRPYYRFQDFVPRSSGTLVAENREGEYSNTLIRILQRIQDTDGIAFLIDEFEDAALGKKLSRRQSAEYHSTLRNLLDTAQDEDFWLTLSSTPQGLEQTRSIEPALMQRFRSEFRIPRLTDQDAYNLAYHRLKDARIESSPDGLRPFADDVVSAIMENNRAWPRGLVKVLSQSLTSAIREGIGPPIPNSLVQKVEADLPTYQVNQDE